MSDTQATDQQRARELFARALVSGNDDFDDVEWGKVFVAEIASALAAVRADAAAHYEAAFTEAQYAYVQDMADARTRITTLEQALREAQEGLRMLARLADTVVDSRGVNMLSIVKRERLNIERVLGASHV